MSNFYVHPKIEQFLSLVDELIELDKDNRKDYHTNHRKMVDIQHEIELSEDYDDDTKLGVFNHLKEVAHERRRTKDTVLIMDALEKLLQSGTSLSGLKDALFIADEEAQRNYAPREIKTLDFSSKEKLTESRKRINYLRNLDEENHLHVGGSTEREGHGSNDPEE